MEMINKKLLNEITLDLGLSVKTTPGDDFCEWLKDHIKSNNGNIDYIQIANKIDQLIIEG